MPVFTMAICQSRKANKTRPESGANLNQALGDKGKQKEKFELLFVYDDSSSLFSLHVPFIYSKMAGNICIVLVLVVSDLISRSLVP